MSKSKTKTHTVNITPEKLVSYDRRRKNGSRVIPDSLSSWRSLSSSLPF
jgi:hypothetical protein